MPRIYNKENEPLDYCKDCFPSNCSPHEDHDADHPDYESDDIYFCEECHTKLLSIDNHA